MEGALFGDATGLLECSELLSLSLCREGSDASSDIGLHNKLTAVSRDLIRATEDTQYLR